MPQFWIDNGFLFVSMALGALLGLSMYLPLMTGQLSLASPGFYAIGGYIGAVMSTRVFIVPAGTPYPVTYVLIEMLIAGIVSGVLAVIIGVPSLRLRGIYLALATIAFVEIVRVLSLNLEITGKAVGIFGIPQPFRYAVEYFWIVAPLLLFTMFFIYRLERSRTGRAFIALREDELAAAAMGVNPTYNKVLAFTLGAILAGVCGAISAHLLNTWNARQGTFDAAVLYLAFVIVGGSRTFWGPVLGGLILSALPEVLQDLASAQALPRAVSSFLTDGRLMIYGFLIAAATIFFPQGIVTPALLRRLSIRPRKEDTL